MKETVEFTKEELEVLKNEMDEVKRVADRLAQLNDAYAKALHRVLDILKGNADDELRAMILDAVLEELNKV